HPLQIFVPHPVPEPPTHLEKGVIGVRRSHEVAGHQALEGESARERIAADHHYGLGLTSVMQPVGGPVVIDHQPQIREYAVELIFQVLERDRSVSEARRVDRRALRCPKASQMWAS